MSYSFDTKELSEHAVLGAGIRTIEGINRATDRIILNTAIDEPTKDNTITITVLDNIDFTQFSQNSDTSTQTSSLEASFQVETDLAGASAEIKAMAEKSADTFVGRFNILLGLKAEINKYKKAELSNEAFELLKMKNDAYSFLARNGDAFISSITKGVVFNAVLKFENITRKNKKKFESQLSAHGKTASSLLSALAQTKGEFHKFLSHEKISYQLLVTQKGGVLISTLNDKVNEARKQVNEVEYEKKQADDNITKTKSEVEKATKDYNIVKENTAKLKEALQKAQKTADEAKEAERAAANAQLAIAQKAVEDSSKKEESLKVNLDNATISSEAAKKSLESVVKKLALAKADLESAESDRRAVSSSQTEQKIAAEAVQPFLSKIKTELDKIKSNHKEYSMVNLDFEITPYSSIPPLPSKFKEAEERKTVIENLATMEKWVLDVNATISKINRCQESLAAYKNVLDNDVSIKANIPIREALRNRINHYTNFLNARKRDIITVSVLSENEFTSLINSINEVIKFENELRGNREISEALKNQPQTIIPSRDIRRSTLKRPVFSGFFSSIRRHWYSYPFIAQVSKNATQFVIRISEKLKGNLKFGYEAVDKQFVELATINEETLTGTDFRKNEDDIIKSALDDIKNAQKGYDDALTNKTKIQNNIDVSNQNLENLKNALKILREQEVLPEGNRPLDLKSKIEANTKAFKDEQETLIKLTQELETNEKIVKLKYDELEAEKFRAQGLEKTPDRSCVIDVPEDLKNIPYELGQTVPSILFRFDHEKGEGTDKLTDFTIVFTAKEGPHELLSPISRRASADRR